MLSLLLHVLDLYPWRNCLFWRLLAGIAFVSSPDDSVKSGRLDGVFSDSDDSFELLDVGSDVSSQGPHPHSHLSGPQ